MDEPFSEDELASLRAIVDAPGYPDRLFTIDRKTARRMVAEIEQTRGAELLMQTTTEVEAILDALNAHDIEEGDVIIVRGLNPEAYREFIPQLQRWLIDHGKRNLVIRLEHGQELEVLTEEAMNAAGWFRQPPSRVRCEARGLTLTRDGYDAEVWTCATCGSKFGRYGEATNHDVTGKPL